MAVVFSFVGVSGSCLLSCVLRLGAWDQLCDMGYRMLQLTQKKRRGGSIDSYDGTTERLQGITGDFEG